MGVGEKRLFLVGEIREEYLEMTFELSLKGGVKLDTDKDIKNTLAKEIAQAKV